MCCRGVICCPVSGIPVSWGCGDTAPVLPHGVGVCHSVGDKAGGLTASSRIPGEELPVLPLSVWVLSRVLGWLT